MFGMETVLFKSDEPAGDSEMVLDAANCSPAARSPAEA